MLHLVCQDVEIKWRGVGITRRILRITKGSELAARAAAFGWAIKATS
jgi:hypothetical protein